MADKRLRLTRVRVSIWRCIPEGLTVTRREGIRQRWRAEWTDTLGLEHVKRSETRGGLVRKLARFWHAGFIFGERGRVANP